MTNLLGDIILERFFLFLDSHAYQYEYLPQELYEVEMVWHVLLPRSGGNAVAISLD